MKIILLKDIPKIGRKNEIKEVSEGYALNFALPRKLAVLATDANVKKVEQTKKIADVERKVMEDLISKNIDSLSASSITVKARTNEKGHLFSGIDKNEIAKEIEKQTRVSIDPEFIILEKPLKEVGQFVLDIKAPHKKGKLKIEILGE
jgi:large subunit ribosomal protein L9